MKEPQYKIVDEEGKEVASGFKSKTCARQMLPGYKINKQDKLEVVAV